MQQITAQEVGGIIQRCVSMYKEDLEKLKAVDHLLGEDATEIRKTDILNSIFAMQNIHHEILDFIGEKQRKQQEESKA